jgi:iron(III) transport system permease protein
MRFLFRYILLLLILAVFAAFLGWPIFQTLRVGFQGIPANGGGYENFTFGYVAAVFEDPLLRAGLLNSLFIAICVTTLCAIISIPLALLSRRYDFMGKGLMNGLLLVPLILPPFVGAIGMRQILARFGALTAFSEDAGMFHPGKPINWFGSAQILGVILVEALSLYPILFLNVSAALANLDPAMEQAAANLGAGRWRIFRRITLPLMRPGIFAGGTIVLIWSFTELGTPLMFDYNRVTPVQIFNQLGQVNANPLPYALTVVMLLSSVLLYIVGKFVLGQKQDAAVTKASVQTTTTKLGFFGSIPVLIPFLFVTALALLPHIGVVLMSVSKVGAWYDSALPTVFTGQNYLKALSSEYTLPAVRKSIEYASLSTVVDIVLGITIAFLIVRSRLPALIKSSIDSLAMLPLAVPGLVMAFGYLALSVRAQLWVSSLKSRHILGWFADKLAVLRPSLSDPHSSFRDTHWLASLVDVHENPTLLLVIAYAMRRLPYVVRSGVAGLEQTPVDLELAARNLGASAGRTLRKITLPLISANLIAGGLLAFAFAMLEVSDSLMLAQKQEFWPITRAIYELFQGLRDGPYIASALGVWAMVLLTLTILSANSLLGKRMGAIFRV